MKAFTVWQPWASLIMAGFKPYEFRGWSAPRYVVGQRVVIHAGVRALKKVEVRDLIEQLASGAFCGGLKLDAVTFLEDVLMDRRKLPLAAALGTVLLGEPKQSCDLRQQQCGMAGRDAQEQQLYCWP